MIRLILHGEMRQFSGGRRSLEVAAAPTVREVLAAASVPAEASAAVIVNGEQRDLATAVTDGDTVEILPAISGGAA